MAKQLTIRGVSDEVSRQLARLSHDRGQSLNATALQILGFDHQKLTHYHNGLDRRLTDVQGRVIREILS